MICGADTYEFDRGMFMDRVKEITNRIASTHFAQLWQFYRDAFHNDEECLQFFYDILRVEPVSASMQYLRAYDEIYWVDSDGSVISDSVFVPRRMLNLVERMVSAARDMEMIRRGKDVFKVVFLVTCAETLQKLAGRDKDEDGRSVSKKDLLFELFEEHTAEEDKQYIAFRFKHDDEEITEAPEDSFKQFIGVINEYRNCAAHEGEYWEYCFNNNYDGHPVLLVVKIDLASFSGNDEKKKAHCFSTEISYYEFEKIFIRTCVNFIKRYVEMMPDTQ